MKAYEIYLLTTLLGISLIHTNNINAQQSICGVAASPTEFHSPQLYNPEIASSNFCVKVYFILYGDGDNEGNCFNAVPLSRTNSIINDLNNAFPSSIQFYFYENETEFVCAPGLNASANSCDYLTGDFGVEKPTDGIIIHVASDDDAGNSYWGLAKSIPSKEFYVGANSIPNSIISQLLTHEMGHCLGLHHTFFGEADCTYSNDCMGYPTELPQPGTNDGISNTGRDPNGTAATDCQSLENSSGGSCRDNNHIYDDIPFDNYMSYYFNCMNRFTNLQIEKMKFNIQNMFGTNPLELCCELPVNTDYTFNSGQTAVWNSNMDVSKIVIEQGAELTIQNATINFDAAGLIDNNGGKLILDNATLRLSPACGDNQWQGIKASYCGSEINIDNSTIRDAAIGVHIQNMVDCGTKVLDIDFSSLINNCNRGILSENSNDEVIIYNSEFENNSIAFETMNAENIKIEDCLFHNNGSIDPDLTPRGIVTIQVK